MNIYYLLLIVFCLGLIGCIIYCVREGCDNFDVIPCILILLCATIIGGGALTGIADISINKDNIVTVTDSETIPIAEVDGRIYDVTDSKYSAHYVVFVKDEDGSVSGEELLLDMTKIIIDVEEGEEYYEVITEKHANKIGLYKTKTVYIIHVSH